MHYKVRGLNLPLQEVENFLSLMKDKYKIIKHDTNNITITEIPKETEVHVLRFP